MARCAAPEWEKVLVREVVATGVAVTEMKYLFNIGHAGVNRQRRKTRTLRPMMVATVATESDMLGKIREEGEGLTVCSA